MNLTISGHHLEVTPSLRTYVMAKLERILRHFDQVVDVKVLLTVHKQKEKDKRQRAGCTVRVKGQDLFVETQHFDLLLSDIVMPEMDGIELAQRCAEISPATKVMFITGFAAVTLKASREAPQARMLSKPFHLKDLVLEVERIFANPAQALN